MQLEFRAPSAALSPYVSTFYHYTCEDEVVEGVDRADVGQIRFMLKGSGTLKFPGGYSEPSTPIMINGPGNGAATYRVEGPFHCFGAALRPVGWCSLIGIPANQRADHVTDGGQIFGPEALALLEELRSLTDIDTMTSAVEAFLLARLSPISPEHHQMADTVRAWLAGGAEDVSSLFEALPWSARHVARLVNQYFGSSPKKLVRKFRALRAATALIEGADPSEVAGQFYDQPHMIREIRHFTGHTPGTLASAMDPVLAVTLQPGFYHELDAPAGGGSGPRLK